MPAGFRVPGWAGAEAAKCWCWPCAPQEGCLGLATMVGTLRGLRGRHPAEFKPGSAAGLWGGEKGKH